MNKSQIELLKKNPATRAVSFDLSTIDEEKRTVEVAFSSDIEVERSFGVEILDHSRGAVDLSLLNDGAPLLDGHDWDKQIGVIERAWVDADGKGRALVRFSRNQHADEIFTDVKDGIRTKISVGYWIEDAEMIGERDSGEPVYRMKWKPYEISFVSVPADNSVGVGRALELPKEEPEQEERQPEPETAPQEPEAQTVSEDDEPESEEVEAEQPQPTIEPETAEPEAERSNVDDLETNQPEQEETAERSAPAVHTNKSKEKDMDNVIDTTPNTVVEAERSAGRQYNVMNAVRFASGDQNVDVGFEREISEELARQEGGEVRGIKIPSYALARSVLALGGRRDLTVGTNGGSNLVAEDHRSDMYIEVLREQTLAGRLGATFMQGLTGDIHIPKQNTKTAFGWLNEGADAPDTDFAFGNVKMTPKTVAGSLSLSRKLMLQSSPQAQALASRDILKGIAETVDNAIFTGTGTGNQPLGLYTHTDLSEVTVATDGSPTYAETIAFKKALFKENVDMDSATYVVDPEVWEHLVTTSKDTGSGRFLSENGMMNGQPLIVTNKLPANGMLLGNFEDILVGLWSSVDLQIDPYTKGKSGALVMNAFQDMDVAIRRGESFAKGV